MSRLPLLLLLCLLAAPACADSLRCGSRLVVTGDWDFSLRERCGEPYFVDRWQALISEAITPEQAITREVRFENWYYDFGPNKLLVRVRLRDDQVDQIETLNIRGRVGPAPDACDDGGLLASGLDIGELVARCGLPEDRDDLAGAVIYGRSPAETVIPERSERWTYRRASGGRLLVWLRGGRIERTERVLR